LFENDDIQQNGCLMFSLVAALASPIIITNTAKGSADK
jgi:hypothetical protein